MAEKWKRELRRVAVQIGDIASILPERRRQRQRDQAPDLGCQVTQGRGQAQPRVALFLLWQPQGLCPSTYLTCQYLVAQGYAVLAVSNAALSSADRAALSAMCWQIVERPNFGHDFGGYRDGIHLLWQWQTPLEGLLLLNDSIWFPLQQSDALLGCLAQESGLSGAAWMERPDRPHAAHLQSYLLHFGPACLQAPAFRAYWQSYQVSSRRSRVLRFGEKGLSQAMREAGLLADPAQRPYVASPAALYRAAEAASPDALVSYLRYAALTKTAHQNEAARLLHRPDAPQFRTEALALIAKSLNSGYFLETHPLLAARSIGLHLLKKRREPSSVAGRQQYLAALAAGAIAPPEPQILTEIRDRDA